MIPASSSLQEADFQPEPDLHPISPTSVYIAPLLSSHSGLNPVQKAELVAHCFHRACVFADHALLNYMFTDAQAHSHIDLARQDEDGLGLVSVTILGFGAESDRDVEREECIRLLVAQGADPNQTDNAGWTSLHHAALFAPPTLVSYLLTHGCSPLSVTRRNLTPLDIVTAHTIIPGREDIALLLEEAMREQGWKGGRMEERRRQVEELTKRKGRRRSIREGVQIELGFHPRWWGSDDEDGMSSDSSGIEDEEAEPKLYTPPVDFASMMVFSPPSLPYIFNSLITTFPPSLRNAEPANALYLLSRFACLTCDHTWLEDLVLGATDAIEEAFFNHPDDITCLVFWLYNITVWLHLMRCDESINEACEMLGSFTLIEEILNSVFVFIIRFAERRIDQLLDPAVLDYSPAPEELHAVQFESEWSLFRSFGAKRKTANPAPASLSKGSTIPTNGVNPPLSAGISPSTSTGLHAFRQSISRGRTTPSTTPLQAIFPDTPPPPSPATITSFLTALHTLMVLAGINPALITQLWSQVMYWTGCEMFNRILTRKKYLCRSKAAHIAMNLAEVDAWVSVVGLPHGVESHFAPVKDLLSWLQLHSAITEFSDLIVTIQNLKSLNPLQMRRAVRDYRFEVNEKRMTEECSQYLAQLQKDWERHRVKLGVEALRKEIDERERDREDSVVNSSAGVSEADTSIMSTNSALQGNIDMLFDRVNGKSTWEPIKPPQVLGELLDSRFMLPLLLPSDPHLLAAVPGKVPIFEHKKSSRSVPTEQSDTSSRTSSDSQERGVLSYRCRARMLRDVGAEMLQGVDGYRAAARFMRPMNQRVEEDEDGERRTAAGEKDEVLNDDEDEDREEGGPVDSEDTAHATQLTRLPSGRNRGPRSAAGGSPTHSRGGTFA